jgi:HSP20 family protein
MNATVDITKEKSSKKASPATAKAANGEPKVPVETGWQSLATLRQEIDRLFENVMTGWPWTGHPFDVRPWTHLSATLGLTMPASDVVETEKAYEITIELPGIDREAIEVNLSDDMISVRAEKSEEHTEEKEKSRWSERRYGSMERSFRLPDGVDDTKVKASYTDGVLRLTLPKTKEAKKKQRKIEVAAK